MAADGDSHQIPLYVMAEIGYGKNWEWKTLPAALADNIPKVGHDKSQCFSLLLFVIGIAAIGGEGANNDSTDFLENIVAAESGQHTVQIFNIDMDILNEQDMALPVELGRISAVEKIDECGKVSTNGDA
mgnify:CR=1 FL=1